jgi:hypothetical protein
MKGRKKNRAEKYAPGMDLWELSELTSKGIFAEDPMMDCVLLHYWVKDWDEEEYNWLEDFTPQMVLENYCKKLLEKKDAAGFERLSKMMRFAAELRSQGLEKADPARAAMIEANYCLYAQIYKKTQYKGNPKKADLLHCFRKTYQDALDIEDADAYRIMRAMGLPRRPFCFTEENQKIADNFFKHLRKGMKKAGK